MNIFAVHSNPVLAAQMLCDSHVVKMTLESAQILMAVHYRYSGVMKKEAPESEAPVYTLNGVPIYGLSHESHPCVLWAGDFNENYSWLYLHFEALLKEYTFRYAHAHSCKKFLSVLEDSPIRIPRGISQFAQVMPREFRVPHDSVLAYRKYYLGKKYVLAKWNRGRPPPQWFTEKSPLIGINADHI